jgi:hypothetical protein
VGIKKKETERRKKNKELDKKEKKRKRKIMSMIFEQFRHIAKQSWPPLLASNPKWQSFAYEDRALLCGITKRAGNRQRRTMARNLLLALPPDEIHHVLNYLIEHYTQDQETIIALLIELAIFCPHLLQPYHSRFLDHSMSDIDGLIYQNAAPDITDELLQKIRHSELSSLSMNRMLCILAWIGNEQEVTAWGQWRQEGYRPSGLYLDPYQYALNAGWELREGHRYEVIIPITYELICSRALSPELFLGPVQCALSVQEPCQWRHKPLIMVFDIDLQDAHMANVLVSS